MPQDVTGQSKGDAAVQAALAMQRAESALCREGMEPPRRVFVAFVCSWLLLLRHFFFCIG